MKHIKRLKRLKKRISDYYHYRSLGYGMRRAWALAGDTL